MSARAYHARQSMKYWVNRNRHYEFNTFNSDLTDLSVLRKGPYKSAAMNFDKQFTDRADKLECYIVTRKNKKYIITRDN
jgi:hypothetical protein